MLKFDRYLLSEFVQATLATTLVLLMVAFGAVFADVLRDIAEGRFPADMLLPQLGLLFLNWLPIILPLALMLGQPRRRDDPRERAVRRRGVPPRGQ